MAHPPSDAGPAPAGIYSSAGTMTCAHYFGSLDLEKIDAQAVCLPSLRSILPAASNGMLTLGWD